MEIIKKDEFKVVGILVEANWRNLHMEMPKAWNLFRSRVEEIKDRINQNYMDICLGKEGDVYTQIICVEVEHLDNKPEGMMAMEIPEQAYVYFKHNGSLKTIGDSFSSMHKWIEEHGYEKDEFKIDYGYTNEEVEEEHALYIRIHN